MIELQEKRPFLRDILISQERSSTFRRDREHYFFSLVYDHERSDVKFRSTKAPNLVSEAEHESGGPFAAYQQPQELVNDLRRMFGKKGPTFGVVAGKTGY